MVRVDIRFLIPSLFLSVQRQGNREYKVSLVLIYLILLRFFTKFFSKNVSVSPSFTVPNKLSLY